jgi:mannitol-1-phosphate 5-dehydrogenase
VRKLGPEDRLVGAAKFALSQGIFPANVCRGIAAGLLFDPPGDPTAPRIREIMKTRGPEAALSEICGLNRSNPISRAVIESLSTVTKESRPDES